MNAFVGTFIGSPAMNLVRSRLVAENGHVQVSIGDAPLRLPQTVLEERRGLEDRVGYDVIVGIRPEDIEDAALAASPNGSTTLDVEVALAESTGAEVIAHFPVKAEGRAGEQLPERELAGRKAAPGETTLTARLNPRTQAETGGPLRVSIDASRLHFFDVKSERSIW